MVDTTAWDTNARQRPERPPHGAGRRTRFDFTQYPDHGPGADVLGIGPGSSVLDLGCGQGGNLAHLAALGARAVGVDASPAQLKAAQALWNGAGLDLNLGDAVTYMENTDEDFDAVYSVFGAAWFTDPMVLLPAVRKALRPGGVFAFSQRPPVGNHYGCRSAHIGRSDGFDGSNGSNGSYGSGGSGGSGDADPLVMQHWDYEPQAWLHMLTEHGFTAATAGVLAAPTGTREIGTLLVRALC
ncbi:class I SAM-dependent methyltransferase [Streptomyces sp. NBC_00344]|uniref:class I SAM-dependent methyltransferase n=1 Tax=Streptomyces sp. NBC_00344 TaxID=2975720 RepID=UPI002E2257E4